MRESCYIHLNICSRNAALGVPLGDNMGKKEIPKPQLQPNKANDVRSIRGSHFRSGTQHSYFCLNRALENERMSLGARSFPFVAVVRAAFLGSKLCVAGRGIRSGYNTLRNIAIFMYYFKYVTTKEKQIRIKSFCFGNVSFKILSTRNDLFRFKYVTADAICLWSHGLEQNFPVLYSVPQLRSLYCGWVGFFVSYQR